MLQTTSRAVVALSGVTAVADIAEVAKFAVKAGYTLTMRHESLQGNRDDGSDIGHHLLLEREYETWLADEVAWLVYLHAYSQGRSIRDVLAETESKLERMCAPLDVPPQDAAGIGEADHEHDD